MVRDEVDADGLGAVRRAPAGPGRDPRREARNTVRGPRLLVVRGSEYMSGESVAFVASVAAENIDAE